MRKYEVNNDEHKKLRFHLDFFKLPSMHIYMVDNFLQKFNYRASFYSEPKQHKTLLVFFYEWQ